MKYEYLFYVIVGFFSGSILFGKIIPFFFKNVDVIQESDDGNPGTFNAFAYGGTGCGLFVLLLDLLKGALPIALCASRIGTDSWLFAFVIAAPVFGHVHSIFNKGVGGKGIAVSFGVLLGLLPIWQPLALLVIWYLFFLAALPEKSNTRKSIYAFFAFAINSILSVKRRIIICGCILMAVIVIHKHYLCAVTHTQPQEKNYEKNRKRRVR